MSHSAINVPLMALITNKIEITITSNNGSFLKKKVYKVVKINRDNIDSIKNAPMVYAVPIDRMKRIAARTNAFKGFILPEAIGRFFFSGFLMSLFLSMISFII